MLRFTALFFSSTLFFASGCGLGSSDCDVTVSAPSTTPASAPPQDWTSTICTSDEHSICSGSLPQGSSLLLCTHDTAIVGGDADGGEDGGVPVLALKCIGTKSGDPSCKSSSSGDEHEHEHHHDLSGGGWSIPNG